MVEFVDPSACPAWDEFVARHAKAGVFHSASWTRLLAETYGFKPVCLLQRVDDQPVAAWPVMEIGGGLSRRRAVSLPFTDTCPPLLPADEDSNPGADLDETARHNDLLAAVLHEGRQRRWQSIELRDCPEWSGRQPASVQFYTHWIDLSEGDASAIERADDAVRRAVRKAERSGLQVRSGSEPSMMRAYYDLHCLTRRRHGLPPQPYPFFENLRRLILAPGLGTIILVLKDQTPIAGGVFLFWGRKAMYKFGASNEAYQGLRPNNLVFREAFRMAVSRGCSTMDLGRTSRLNAGLRRFKLGWGSVEREISYLRYDLRSRRVIPTVDRAHSAWQTRLFRHLPPFVGTLIGRFAYRFAA